MPISYPAAQDTFSDEQNEYLVDGVPTGGTFTDATKQNRLYDVTEALQAVVGYSGDAAGAIGSHTAQLKYLLAGGGAVLPQGPSFAPAPADGQLQILTSQAPMGFYRWDAATAAWHLLGADARALMTQALPSAAPTTGQTLQFDGTAWTYVSGLTNPMSAAGDLIVATTGGAATRLPRGTDGQVLTLVAGMPAWGGAAMSNPMTNSGDLIVGALGGAPARLPAGTDGQFFRMSGTSPAWVTTTVLTNPLTQAGDLIVGGSPVGGVAPPTRLAIGANGTVLGVSAGAYAWLPAATNPMTVQGDLILGGAGGASTRLPIGAANRVLTSDGTTASWQPPAFSDPMTTRGDLIVRNASNVTARLAKGTDGQVLTMVSGDVGWAAATGGGMTDPMSTAGDVIIRNGSNVTTRLGIGSTNQVLTVIGGVPSWQNAASGFADPMTSAGDLIMRNGSNVTTRLGIGSTNQVLTVIAGVPSWQTPSGGGGVDWSQNGNTVGAEKWLGTVDGYALPLRTANNERARIGVNGNVGIATTQIGAKLEIQGTVTAGTSDRTSRTGSKTGTTVTLTVGTFDTGEIGRLLIWADGTVDVVTAYTDSTHVTVATSATIGSQSLITKDTLLYVAPWTTQAVGIATANPTSIGSDIPTLHVRGGPGDNNKSGGVLWTSNDASHQARANFTGGAFQLGTTTAHDGVLIQGSSGNTERLRLVNGSNSRFYPKAVDDSSFAYNTSSLMVTQQTAASTTVLNDPQAVIYLQRLGTAGQCYAPGAALMLSRYEAVSTNSRSRVDLALAHGSFDVEANKVQTWLSSGNIGMGTAAPSEQLHIRNGSTDATLSLDSPANSISRFFFREAGSLVGFFQWRGSGASAPSSSFEIGSQVSAGSIRFYTGASTVAVTISSTRTVQFNGYGAGSLSTDATGLITASDARLKEQLRPFRDGLAALAKLTPVRYRWTAASGGDRAHDYVGFTAQNVQEAIPEAVGPNGAGYLNFQDRPLIAALCNAVNELAARLAALEARRG